MIATGFLGVFGEIWFTIFGLVVGSFLNAFIYRNPRGYPMTLPSRSGCTNCGHVITWVENIPVLSYLMLRGRCSSCGTPIGLRSPLVELFCGLLFYAVFMHFSMTFLTLYYAAFIAALLAVTFIDIDFRIIPDEISIGGAILAIALSPLIEEHGLTHSLIGAFSASAAFFLMGWIYRKVTGRDGLGFGDVKLLVFIGAVLGVRGAFLTIILSSFLGSIVGIIIVLTQKKNLRMAVPYGPFLAIGAMIVVFWGDSIELSFYPLIK